MNMLALGIESLAAAPLLGIADLGTQIVAWTVVLLAAGVLLSPSFRPVMAGVLSVVVAVLAIGVGLQVSSPLITGTMLGAVGLICLLPPSRTDLRVVGGLFFGAALGLYAYVLALGHTTPAATQIVEWVVFGVLALLAVGAAIAMVSSRSAVYSAIWFALTLLATGGLFLYQGAQFLGVATVTVYAGAIVVTFLFVIMLAQPDGHATYDRLSWGWFAKPAAAVSAALLMGSILYVLERVEVGTVRERVAAAVDNLSQTDDPLPFISAQVASATMAGKQLKLGLTSDAVDFALTDADHTRLRSELAALDPQLSGVSRIELQPALRSTLDPQHQRHMASLGGYLFSRHLLAVEVAGTLLLAALVGAISMLSQGAAATRRAGETHV